jgi:hypothetical protein
MGKTPKETPKDADLRLLEEMIGLDDFTYDHWDVLVRKWNALPAAEKQRRRRKCVQESCRPITVPVGKVCRRCVQPVKNLLKKRYKRCVRSGKSGKRYTYTLRRGDEGANRVHGGHHQVPKA